MMIRGFWSRIIFAFVVLGRLVLEEGSLRVSIMVSRTMAMFVLFNYFKPSI